MSQITSLSEHEIDTLIQAHQGWILVDCWASWCGPCLTLGRVLEQMAPLLKGVKIVKLDIDQNGEWARRHQIRSIPTLQLFYAGKLFDTRIGSMDAQQLRTWIESAQIKVSGEAQ